MTSRGWVIVYKGIELTDPMRKDIAEQKMMSMAHVVRGLELREAFW